MPNEPFENMMEQNLPVSMKVSDIADFMGISMSTAYKLVKSPGFPVIKLPNIRRVVISKSQFLKWYHRNDLEQTQIK